MGEVRGNSRVFAAVDLDAAEFNYTQIQRSIKPGTKIIAVIKTDGYGHGALPLAELLEQQEGLWGFAVATVEEALALREGGIASPILILGYTFPEHYEKIVAKDLRPAVFSLHTAKLLSEEAARQGKPVKLHIKIDTGMSRIGFADKGESLEEIRRIKELPQVELEGIFTHFARADERDKESARSQLRRFTAFVESCESSGIHFSLHHCSNSAGIMELREANMDAVRAGIILYGLYPSQEVSRDALELKPLLSLKSHLVYVKEVEPGTSISYGGTYTADGVRRIATVPVGYGDGYPRQLSNKGYVLICGKKAPIRGRVCMDQMMVDVTEIPEAREGIEVTLVGEDQGERITVEELGDLSGRFNYEFVCCITKRVPRIYYRGGRPLGIQEDF